MRILIAEDDRCWPTACCARCATPGYAVDRSAAAARPTPRSPTHEFDLLILDLGLPQAARPRSAAQAARARLARCRC